MTITSAITLIQNLCILGAIASVVTFAAIVRGALKRIR